MLVERTEQRKHTLQIGHVESALHFLSVSERNLFRSVFLSQIVAEPRFLPYARTSRTLSTPLSTAAFRAPWKDGRRPVSSNASQPAGLRHERKSGCCFPKAFVFPSWNDAGWQETPRRRQWHPTPVLLPGKSHGRRSPVGCSPRGR